MMNHADLVFYQCRT